MSKTYNSKFSYGLIILVSIVFLGSPILNLVRGNAGIYSTTTSLVSTIILSLIIHMLLATTYKIEEHKLKIKCGFFNYKPVKINQITEIRKSNNIKSSPAPSFDRIEIKYGAFNSILISPQNKFEFIRHITDLNPQIINKVYLKQHSNKITKESVN